MLNASGFALATLAKVSKPAFTKASAAFGPAPSIFFKSSAFPVAFFAAALGAAFLASVFGAATLASTFGSTFLTSFFGAAFSAFAGAAFLAPSFSTLAAFLAPEATMLSITISDKDCL